MTNLVRKGKEEDNAVVSFVHDGPKVVFGQNLEIRRQKPELQDQLTARLEAGLGCSGHAPKILAFLQLPSKQTFSLCPSVSVLEINLKMN